MVKRRHHHLTDDERGILPDTYERGRLHLHNYTNSTVQTVNVVLTPTRTGTGKYFNSHNSTITPLPVQNRRSLLTIHNIYLLLPYLQPPSAEKRRQHLMEKGCINKRPAEIVSEHQTREETAMFPDANNHSLPDARKDKRYDLGTGTKTR